MQLEFLWEELTGSYKGVLSKLKAAKSAQEASDIILTGYEKPKDQWKKGKRQPEDLMQKSIMSSFQ